MKIKPEELVDHNFVLLDQLDHKDLVPFIRMYLKKRTKYSLVYYLINALLLGLTLYTFAHGSHEFGYETGSQFTHFSYGIAIAFMLLPFHEFVHVLAYRLKGATKATYGANLKKFYFMALADQFVANKQEFEFIALAPFLIINSALLFLLIICHPEWKITVLGTLLTHISMCSGDFGLLSYFEYHKHKNVVTFDDTNNKMSYFYGQQPEVNK